MQKKFLDMFTKPLPEKQEAAAEGNASVHAEDEAADRLKLQVNELLEMFPKLKAEAIPAEVWDRVIEGDSICAAYCLWLVKSLKEKSRIDTVNDKNKRSAPPKVTVHKGKEDYFSADTVKKMSSAQIRDNLDAILRSMDSWK